MVSWVDKFADVLVRYSLALKPGDQLRIQTDPDAEEFTLAVYREVCSWCPESFFEHPLS